jgi:hypothetical protein
MHILLYNFCMDAKLSEMTIIIIIIIKQSYHNKI